MSNCGAGRPHVVFDNIHAVRFLRVTASPTSTTQVNGMIGGMRKNNRVARVARTQIHFVYVILQT